MVLAPWTKGERLQLVSPWGYMTVQCQFGRMKVPNRWWGTVIDGGSRLITVQAPTILWDEPFDCGPVIVPVHWLHRPDDDKEEK